MTTTSSLKDVAQLNFEEAMAELEQVVRQLEEGRVPLDQAIAAYERGSVLKARCDELLKTARLKVEEIYQNKDNGVEVKPSDLQRLVDGPTS